MALAPQGAEINEKTILKVTLGCIWWGWLSLIIVSCWWQARNRVLATAGTRLRNGTKDKVVIITRGIAGGLSLMLHLLTYRKAIILMAWVLAVSNKEITKDIIICQILSIY